MKLLFTLLILASSVYAWQELVVGKVLVTGLYAQNNTAGADCAKFANPPSMGNRLQPFHGQTIAAVLDPNDPPNAVVIAWNGGSQFLNSIRERCDPTTGELIETGCSDAYPQYLGNLWAAVSLLSSDMTLFGAQPGSQWTCTEYIGAYFLNGPYLGNNPNAAFYTPTINGYSFATNTQTPVPLPSGFISNGFLYGSVIPPNPSTFTLDGAYVIGPLPSTNILPGTAMPGCPTGTCTIPATPVTCPGIYHVVGLLSNGMASARSIAC